MSKTSANQITQNALEEITFVNAASLPYAHVQVDGNTLFSGRNGAGKTTILRAVLYFYGAYRSEQLGISRGKKKRFEEYYFGATNSYLIYRFANEYGPVWAIVYKTSGVKVKYRFATLPKGEEIDEARIKELLFKEGVAKESKELFNSLVGAGFELSPVLTSSKEYKQVLYGQDRRLVAYSFFQANAEYEQIAKTLSNIFVNSKLDSGSIKKSLAASISGFDPIDLGQMQQSIDAFALQYEDIKSFEKHEPVILDAVKTLSLLEEGNQQIKTKLAQLESNQLKARETIGEMEQQVADAQEALNENRSGFDIHKAEFEKGKENYLQKVAVIESQVNDARAKEAEYQSAQIEAKLAAWEKLPTLEAKQQSIMGQKGLLTQKFASIHDQFEAMKEQESKALDRQRQTLLERLNALESAFNSDVANLMAQQEQAFNSFEMQKEQTLSASVEQFERAKEQRQQQSYKLQQVQNQNFLHEELELAKESLTSTKSELGRIQNSIQIAKKDLEIIYAQVSQKEQGKAQQKELIRARYLHQKEQLQSSIDALENKVSHLENSVAGFILKSDLKEKNRLLGLLKDEVLFASGLSPKISQGSTILGLELDLERIEPAVIDLEGLNRELSEHKEALGKLSRAYEEEDAQIDNGVRNELNALKRDEAKLRENLDALVLDLPKFERAHLEANEAHIKLSGEAVGLKAAALEEAQKELDAAEASYSDAYNRLEAQKSEFSEQKDALRAKFNGEKEQLSNSKASQKERLESELATLEVAAREKLDAIKAQEKEALEKGGVDTSHLESLEHELGAIEQEIAQIKKDERLIKEYEIDKERIFRQLPHKEAELATLKDGYKKEALAFEVERQNFERIKAEQQQSIAKVKSRLHEMRADLEAYEKFKDSAFYQSFESIPVSDTEPNEESLRELATALNELIFSKERNSKDLSDKLRKVYNNLSQNSSLNLQRPASDDEVEMIIAARELKTFVNENKIETFKTEVARLYTTTLHHIASETTELLKADSDIKRTVNEINGTLKDLQGIKVIENIELRFKESDNPVLNHLKAIAELSASMPYGTDNLFSASVGKREHNQIIRALGHLASDLAGHKADYLQVEDSFVLEFRAIENGHDTGFVPSLDGIGSNGTDVMVKAMVYIAMLSLAREQSAKENSAVYFHCILDEVGILAPNYLKELIEYANNKKIRFLNGAPDEKLVTTYKRLYMLSTNAKHQTMVRRLLAQA